VNSLVSYFPIPVSGTLQTNAHTFSRFTNQVPLSNLAIVKPDPTLTTAVVPTLWYILLAGGRQSPQTKTAVLSRRNLVIQLNSFPMLKWVRFYYGRYQKLFNFSLALPSFDAPGFVLLRSPEYYCQKHDGI
jgi:hypothetical protein